MITPGSIHRAKERAVGGKKDRCSIGKSCSATCIQGVKVCLVDLPDAVSASMVKFKSMVDREVRTMGNQAQKVLPGLRGRYLAGRNEKYNSIQGKLIKQIERASVRGDTREVDRLKSKYEKLQGDIGKKLNVTRTEPKILEEASRKRRDRYYTIKKSFIQKMNDAASNGKKGYL